MEILSVKDWYYEQLRKGTGKTMSHFELAENYSKYILEKQERSYSEKEVLAMLLIKHDGLSPDYVLEQFKKK